jgi:hypothetical protein
MGSSAVCTPRAWHGRGSGGNEPAPCVHHALVDAGRVIRELPALVNRAHTRNQRRTAMTEVPYRDRLRYEPLVHLTMGRMTVAMLYHQPDYLVEAGWGRGHRLFVQDKGRLPFVPVKQQLSVQVWVGTAQRNNRTGTIGDRPR